MMSAIGNAFKSKVFDSHQGQNWSPFFNHISDGAGKIGDHQIAMKYLEHFAFQNGGSLNEFKSKNNSYLNQSLIERIENQVRIWSAKRPGDVMKLHKDITSEMFAEQRKIVRLKFCDHNKEKFTIPEKVVLHLDIQNI